MAIVRKEITFYVTQRERGSFLAATNESPFFCFEAETEAELFALVDRALKFYVANFQKPTPVVSRDVNVSEFLPTQVIVKDLAVA